MDSKLKRILIIICALMAILVVQNTVLITFLSIDRCGGASTVNSQNVQPGSPSANGSSESSEELLPEVIYSDLKFSMCFRNPSGGEMTLKEIVIEDYMNGQLVRNFAHPASNLIPPEACVIVPGGELPFEDWHPAPDALEIFSERHYIFVLRAPDGSELRHSFIFPLEPVRETVLQQSQAINKDYSQDEGKDLLTLRYDADFDVEVYPGVHWVPARSLGDSRYTNAEISAMLKASPEEKRDAISSVYEALQLYQVGNFSVADDNIRIPENGIDWEHHKPGYDAVRTNAGCCATDSNWLRYLLDGDYDEIGYIATSQRDGSGHIYNYILHNGMYYFIDLTHYRNDWIATATESGSMDDYNASDRALGNIHCVQSVDRFVEYVINSFGEPPAIMFKYTAENCLAVDGQREQNGIFIVYEEAPGVNLEIIYDDPNDNVSQIFAPAPANRPDYGAEPGFAF